MRALQCAIVDQNIINNPVVRTAQEVRTALSAHKQRIDTTGDSRASGKAIDEEISKTIDNIQVALDKIEEGRARTQADNIKGERRR